MQFRFSMLKNYFKHRTKVYKKSLQKPYKYCTSEQIKNKSVMRISV